MTRTRVVALLASAFLLLVAPPLRAGEEEDTTVKTEKGPVSHFTLRAFGGPSYGELYRLRASGASFGLGAGGDAKMSWGGIGGSLDLVYDALATGRGGLGLRRGIVAFTPELLLWRVRFGVGIHGGFLAFDRVSGSRGSPSTTVLGLHATFAVDLLTVLRTTLYLGARGDLGTLSSFGASAGLRYAF